MADCEWTHAATGISTAALTCLLALAGACTDTGAFDPNCLPDVTSTPLSATDRPAVDSTPLEASTWTLTPDGGSPLTSIALHDVALDPWERVVVDHPGTQPCLSPDTTYDARSGRATLSVGSRTHTDHEIAVRAEPGETRFTVLMGQVELDAADADIAVAVQDWVDVEHPGSVIVPQMGQPWTLSLSGRLESPDQLVDGGGFVLNFGLDDGSTLFWWTMQGAVIPE